MGRNKWLFLGLLVSLAVNLALVASLIYGRIEARRPPSLPPPHFRNDFQVPPEKRQQVHSLIHGFRIRSLELKEEILTKRVEIIEELGNPDSNPDTIKIKTAELNQLESQLNDAFINILQQISDLLDPGQRLNLLYRLGQNWFFINPIPEKGGSHD